MANNYIQDGDVLSGVNLGATFLSGAPSVLGQLPGVVLKDTVSSVTDAFKVSGVFDLSVKGIDGSGNSAVAIGDKLYYTSGDTPMLNKKTTGVEFGIALEAIASGETDTINVRLKG